MSDYVELRCRSAFTFLAGASLPEDLVVRAAELNYPVLGLGDRDGLYGVPRFHRAAQDVGLRALVGCSLSFQPSSPDPCNLPPAPCNLFPPTSTLYLLVENQIGYRNLCRLLTAAKLRAAKGQAVATWSDLEEHSAGLVCLAGGADGVLSAALRCGDDAVVNGCMQRLKSFFGDRLYVDLQRHLDPVEERLNHALLDVARRYNVPIVATNDVQHATREEKPLHDVLTCIRARTTLDEAGRRLLKNAERCLKPPKVMAALFRDLPEAVANTRNIAERCTFTLGQLGYRFPSYPLPPGVTSAAHLRSLVYSGARERYGTLSERVRRQLEHELAIIEKLDLAGYFLIVWDIMRYCRSEGILAQGRGSAANSAVCYALGITAVDAVGMDLLFERFLSEERGEWPDIDIDLPSGEQREKVIQYVYRRYGERGAAMTATVITYRTRSAVREVGKVLGFSGEQIDRVIKYLPRFEFRDDMDDPAKQIENGGLDPAAPRVALLIDLVNRIRRLPRHLGQHSGGMVIAAGRLDEIVPLEPATMPGRVVVQWDKDDCARLGIIKVDLLGLGMLAVLEEAISLVREHEGKEVDLAHLPQDDPAVYRMLRAADTIGVFQVESRAQMATLPRMKPERFYDLVVEVAIVRPGPIVGEMVNPYLERRNGRAPVTYAHPLLEPILKRTLGVPLFQEQILRIAMAVAGFTGGEAEELRRAMGDKQSRLRMRELESRLRAGMAGRGITGPVADEIVHSIMSFALYGFPESHAASFALIAYASAYLRVHHLAAFTCAMLNNWPLGFYHPSTLVKDAQRHGLRVLPIDVMRSHWKCTVEGGGEKGQGAGYREQGGGWRGQGVEKGCHRKALAVRLGLRHVRGLRQEAAERLVAVREQRAFTSIADVAARARLRDDELETLAHIGAFAPFGVTRRDALWQVAALPPRGTLFEGTGGRLQVTGCRLQVAGYREQGTGDRLQRSGGRLQMAGERQEGARSGPLSASPSPLPPEPCPLQPVPLKQMSSLERTLADYSDAGMTVGPQLVKHLRAELARQGVVQARDLARLPPGGWVKLAGLVIVRQRPGTAKGVCFLTLEDETGLGNVVITPDLFRQHRALIHTATLLLVEGPLQKADGVVHVLARRFRSLELPR